MSFSSFSSPSQLPLSALRAFEAAARCGSFKAAAEELAVTPAAVSHQVRKLEELVGVALFERQHRAVTLSEGGRRLYPDIHEAFEVLLRGLDRLRPEEVDPLLTIGCGPGFAAKWLAPRLWRFMETNPEIEPRIAAQLAMSKLGPGGVDVSLRFGTSVPDDAYSEVLLTERVLPLCTPELARAHALRAPADLARAPLVHDDATASVPDWAGWARAAGVSLRTDHGLRFNHADHAIDAAAEGAGVVLGRETMAYAERRAGRLVCPFGPALATKPALRFLCLEGLQNEPKRRALLDWLREETALFREALEALE